MYRSDGESDRAGPGQEPRAGSIQPGRRPQEDTMATVARRAGEAEPRELAAGENPWVADNSGGWRCDCSDIDCMCDHCRADWESWLTSLEAEREAERVALEALYLRDGY